MYGAGGMVDTNEFTFCQVARVEDEENLESPKLIPKFDVVSITHDCSSCRVDAKAGSSQLIDSANFKELKEDDSFPSNGITITATVSKLSNTNGKGGLGNNDGLQEQKSTNRKPIQRAKVPFEKGYSQMDWLKLTRTHPDLAGLKGQSNRRLISMNEVKQHKVEGSVWTVLKGRVYNISPYMKFHPGGADMLMKAAGKDCTSLFNKYHAWVNAEFLLEQCLVGFLDDSQ